MLGTGQIAPVSLLALTCACVASFLNVVVDRTARGERWAGGRSYCDTCRATLDPLSMVPVVGFLVRHGRCRACRAAIPWAYPLSELLAVIAGVSAWALADGPALGLLLALSWLLLWISLDDIATGHILRPLNGVLALLGGGWVVVTQGGWLDAAAGAALGLGLFAGLRFAYRCLRGQEGLGLGDVLFAGAAGIWTGMQGLGPMIVIGSASALVWALISGRRGGPRARVPFGPFLALGLWLTVIGTQAGIGWP